VQELGIAEIGGIAAIDEDPSPPVDDRSFAITHRPDTYIKTVVFGDSVVLSGREALKNAISGLALDAKVGRQPSEIAAHIRARRATHRLGQDVVIHMGTNGLVRREDLAPILNMLHDRRRVVVVNVHVPRVWATATNKMIANIVKDYPNVRMADWNTVSTGHRKYFARDGFHLSQAGGTVFAQLIQSTLTAP
jgi:hypothetical protein